MPIKRIEQRQAAQPLSMMEHRILRQIMEFGPYRSRMKTPAIDALLAKFKRLGYIDAKGSVTRQGGIKVGLYERDQAEKLLKIYGDGDAK